MSDQLWIYWAAAIPATIVSVVLGWMWPAHNDSLGKFKAWSGWAGQPWGKMKAAEQESEKPKHESV